MIASICHSMYVHQQKSLNLRWILLLKRMIIAEVIATFGSQYMLCYVLIFSILVFLLVRGENGKKITFFMK